MPDVPFAVACRPRPIYLGIIAAGVYMGLTFALILLYTLSMDEIDIWRSAELMIRRYGDQAEDAAEARVTQAMEKENPDRWQVWQRITRAVRYLRRLRPKASEG